MANHTLEGSRCEAIPRQSVSQRALIGAVEGTLADFLASQIAALDAVDPALGGFARTARDLVMAGGKRLRPTFAYWGWRGVVGPTEPVESVLPAFGALELMHTFALVHDDLMDESDTRRGRPTAHRIFASQHGEHFGGSAAILVGDLCLVWADQLLSRTRLPAATLLEVRDRYDRMRVEAIAGQYLDVLGESDPASWSVERALTVARHKTASYTIQWPLSFGAALAGGDRRLDEAFRVYGTTIGEAFQLRDDMLGVYGDPAVTGKPAADDLRTGKPTTLLMLARRMSTDAQLAAFADGDIARRAQIIAETGAPRRIEEMIRVRVDEGLAALSEAPIHPDARAALIDLATAATQRPA
ncbi:putative polyprenyl diphosphate synthetase [Actinoplanes missouriensis 431]|uniref:Putative polyprenyl diphosphate synthetase n=1 Tax=Actinoplanes missouriensis (strain ATCC 14538 / DSM 43046 / CBS 188.64 / JCM 3121 / NBRC 102363 / NCIMB 12654 / NRRL B-3342 / UNCC 431) TaxID=512565 RepID=I0GX80_ACTM4|nr:putative polyprenyl diphosphate synthetase [Actinoplanes missouriensis 431]